MPAGVAKLLERSPPASVVYALDEELTIERKGEVTQVLFQPRIVHIGEHTPTHASRPAPHDARGPSRVPHQRRG